MAGTTGLEPATSDVTGQRNSPHVQGVVSGINRLARPGPTWSDTKTRGYARFLAQPVTQSPTQSRSLSRRLGSGCYGRSQGSFDAPAGTAGALLYATSPKNGCANGFGQTGRAFIVFVQPRHSCGCE